MQLVSLSRRMALACSACMVLSLAACGGGSSDSTPPTATSGGGSSNTTPPTAVPGGGSSDTPPPTAAPDGVIRYEVNYEPSGALPGSTVQSRYLTVRPIPGATTMGTRATSSVEVTVGQEQPRTLTAPTYVDAQGRPNYVFSVDPSYPFSSRVGYCPPTLPLTVTVTDTAGLSFTKYDMVCAGESQTVDAASDYGDHAATFSASGPAGATQATFMRTAPAPMLDATKSTPTAGSVTWSLRVADGDQLASDVAVAQGAAPGSAATARLDLEGGAYAQSVAGLGDPAYTNVEAAALLCCGAAPDPSAPMQTVSFAVDPQLIAFSTSITVPVDVKYRIVDGVTGQTRVDWSATLELAKNVDTVWTFQARQGDRMFLQASSPEPSSHVWITIENGSGGPNLARVFGQASTAVPDTPAILNVSVPPTR